MADWFDEQGESPAVTAAQTSSNGYNPPQQPSGGANGAALLQQYQQSHPYGGDIQGLYQFLQQNGVNVGLVDHRGQPSADKLWIDGRMLDVVGSSDGPNAHWASHDVTDEHYAAQAGKTGGSAPMGATGAGSFGSLAQGWNTPFKSPGGFKAPTMADAENSPGFQFRLGEGLKALERSAAAKGTLLTGGTLKDMNAWAQDYAGNEYDKVYGRALGENNLAYGRAFGEYGMNRDTFYQNQDNQYSRYMGLAGLGQQSAGQLGAYGSSYMNQGNDLMTGAGNAQAAGTMGSANAWGGLYGAGGDLFNTYMGSR